MSGAGVCSGAPAAGHREFKSLSSETGNKGGRSGTVFWLSSPPSILFFFHRAVSSALFTAAPLKRSAETRFR